MTEIAEHFIHLIYQTWLYLLLACVVPAVISVYVSVRFHGAVTRVAARIGGLAPRPKRRIDGIWFSTFWFFGSSTGNIVKVRNLIRIRTAADRFVGETVGGNEQVFTIEGESQSDTYVTGKWQHKTPDNLYHGSVHLHVELEGDVMQGKWLGFNKKQAVASGVWVLARLSRDSNARAVRFYTASYCPNGVVDVSLLPADIRKRAQDVLESEKKTDVHVSWHDAII